MIALDSKYSCGEESERDGVKRECGGREERLFFRWSGVAGGDDWRSEGGRVGEDGIVGGGRVVGSKSRWGMGGDKRGLRVMRRRVKRRAALGGGDLRGR